MTKLLGIQAPSPEDWSLEALGWIFSIALGMLGLSAAMFGKWLEKVGPRRAMAAATACFGGGFMIAALGVNLHQLALVYLGYGVLGGVGPGPWLIFPASTLYKGVPGPPGKRDGW